MGPEILDGPSHILLSLSLQQKPTVTENGSEQGSWSHCKAAFNLYVNF